MYTINVNQQLLCLDRPIVMGILNVTPDSFFAESRVQTAEAIRQRALQIVGEGGKIIDVGACSTRPGGEVASEEEELRRLRFALPIIAEACPGVPLSVDTFRAGIARICVEEYGVGIINDVNEGRDPEMFATVARLGVPYILMSTAPTMEQMLLDFSREVQQLRDLGQKDIILDPGFGFGSFGKTLEENYAVLREMEQLQVMELPVLAGVSRKSMIYRFLGTSPDEALNGTTVLNTVALQKGAAILRVHDVREAVECVKIVQQTNWTRACSLV